MQIKNALKSILLIISMSSVATAQLTPYPGSGGTLGPGRPGQPPMHPGHPGRPGQPPMHPGHPGRPGHPPAPPMHPPRPRPPMPPPPPMHPPRPRPPAPPPYYPPPRPPMPPPPPHNPPPYYPPPAPPTPPPPSYGDYEVRRIYLSRDVFNENIDLRTYGGVDHNFSGWEVISVRGNTRPNNPNRTVAQIVLDGRVWATQINPGHLISLVPQSRLIIDQSGRDLRLAISGGTYVDSIEIELRRAGGYNPPPPSYGRNIDVYVNRSVFGNDRIDLNQFVDLRAYRGMRIEQVIVAATTRFGSGYVNLLINGLGHGQLQFSGSGFSQRQTIWLNNAPMIGSGAESIVLNTSGDMTIEQVTLVVR